MDTTTFLIVPGWCGSGAGHWQTIWQERHSNFRRVEQDNWDRPSRKQWVQGIRAAVHQSDGLVFLVAHSLGCLAVAHWAEIGAPANVAGALLVAPPWLTLSNTCPAPLLEFLPMPTRPLPFPSVLAASTDDPYLPFEIAPRLAKAWGSEFVDLGRQGHVNVASGHGDWPEGEQLLEHLTQRSFGAAEVVA